MSKIGERVSIVILGIVLMYIGLYLVVNEHKLNDNENHDGMVRVFLQCQQTLGEYDKSVRYWKAEAEKYKTLYLKKMDDGND